MNPNDREELVRLLPAPVERELPGERHRQLQEFLMSEIHRDLRTTGPASRRPLLRRSVLATSALTVVAALAAAIGVGVTGNRGDDPSPPAPAAPAALSGPEILLAAATTAERQTDGTGTYWYVKVVSTNPAPGSRTQWENWYDREGRIWLRSGKTGDRAVKWSDRGRFIVGWPDVTFQQLQALPTGPDALTAWLTDATANSDNENSGGKLTPDMWEQHVFYGLIALVSQLPAPPKVRAAAFQAIAAYPGVESLGPVDGGQGLRISFRDGLRPPARLVVDPVTAQVRQTDFFVTVEGALYSAGEGGTIALTSGWTDTLPT